MSTPQQLHDEAMSNYDTALIERGRGNHDIFQRHLRSAFDLERAAALAILDVPGSEPSRSVLCRSAASIALQINENREAEKLICLALAGEPPPEIADELRDLLEQIMEERHLQIGEESPPYNTDS